MVPIGNKKSKEVSEWKGEVVSRGIRVPFLASLFTFSSHGFLTSAEVLESFYRFSFELLNALFILYT